MRRFKNILAVYCGKIGADDVLEQAVSLARANSARLTVIDVLPERYATRAERDERAKSLSRLRPAIEADGVTDVRFEVFIGTPFLEIIRQVLREHHDLVIASADGGSSLRNAYFGSTATRLMRKCPTPVWIVNPGQSSRYQRILACIDPKTPVRADNEMEVKILDLATSLAAEDDAELHVVHAWDVEGSDRDMLTSEIRDETRQEIIERHHGLHRARVTSLLEPYDLDPAQHQIHVPRASQPQEAIIDLVARHDVDLIVMGTVSRTGISGLIIGNAAESVLNAVRCGVLTVKPEGFVSPVTLQENRLTA